MSRFIVTPVRFLSGFAQTLAIAYLFVCLFMYGLQRDLLFRPSGSLTSPAANGLGGTEAEQAVMADGTRITVWRAPPAPDRPVVLHFHGNSGNLADRAERYRRIVASGMGLYAVTYRGFAGAGGSPSEAALIADAIEHFDRLRAETAHIVIYGESLGSGVAAALAGEREASALILEAPFTAAMDIARERYPWLPVSLLMSDPFLTREKIGAVDEPVFIVHGTADRVVPLAQGKALFDLAGEPKDMLVIEGANHHDLWARGLWPAAVDFVSRALAPNGREREGIVHAGP